MENQCASLLNPVDKQSKCKKTKRSPAPSTSGLIEYGPNGEALNANRLICTQRGFDVDVSVFEKGKPEKVLKIIGLLNEKV